MIETCTCKCGFQFAYVIPKTLLWYSCPNCAYDYLISPKIRYRGALIILAPPWRTTKPKNVIWCWENLVGDAHRQVDLTVPIAKEMR